MVVDVIDSHSGRAAAASALLELSTGAQRAEADVGDRFVRAREKNVEDRQGAFQFLRIKTYLHVFRDEKAEAKRGIHLLLEVVERAPKIADLQWSGGRAHRFLSAENVNGRLWKELIDVEKIGTAEHVEQFFPQASVYILCGKE